ncbi:hypothetical protein BH09ACT9_BH09ACT9_00730 [soil metagenome]
MITAALQGRDLHLTVEGIEAPFIIRPLPGKMGKHITDLYLRITARELPPHGMEDLFRIAVDGGQWVEDGQLVPLPEDQRVNYNRADDELSQSEAQDFLLPAFFWQTILGIDGVNEYIQAGGGMAGGVKLLGSLALTLGVSPLLISQSSALETLIQKVGDTPTTTTPQGGPTLAKLPAEKRSINQGKRPKR